MKEDILKYLPTVMFRGTPCIKIVQMLRIIQSLDITTTSTEVKMRSTVTNQSLNQTSQ